MAEFSSFVDQVLTHVPSAPEPLVVQALRNAAIEFAERTHALRATVTATPQIGSPRVRLTPPIDTRVLAVDKMWFAGEAMHPASPEQVDVADAYFGAAEPGTPQRYHLLLDNTVQIYPPPNRLVERGIIARVVVVPTEDGDELPDELVRFTRVIAAGARGFLKNIPGQPFSGDPSADFMYFNRRVMEEHAIAKEGSVRGPLRVQAPLRFAPGRR